MNFSGLVRIVEVGPRDGLQNEKGTVTTAQKIELIERLAAAGLPVVESGAFVSPKWVPQMADTAAVLAGVKKRPGVRYPVLVPNRQGYEAAKAAGVDEIAVFAAASETFSRNNLNCSIDESLDRFAPVMSAAATDGMRVRAYISCAIACPYEGRIAPRVVARLASRLFSMGCFEISLGDTLGVGTPADVGKLIAAVADEVPVEQMAGHFHDTYGLGVANVYAALQAGVRVFDSSVAGLGGCPFARGASGNVATEDVLYLFAGLGIDTGVDLAKVAEAGRFICEALNRPLASRTAQALRASTP